jgi:ParB-like chromosome segregation protein Spo0J
MTCPQEPRLDHDQVYHVSLDEITPSPENDDLYRPVDIDDSEIVALADSIVQNGLREPIVLSSDGYILSGHRRYAACEIAGLSEVPVRYESISHEDDPDEFVHLLREFNRQRVKTLDERLREEVVSADPDTAHEALIEHRERASVVETAPIAIRDKAHRCAISKAKQPFLEAILDVLNERRKFWPLSDRAIHYGLLNAHL